MWATQLATALSQEGNTTAFPILSPQPTFFWIYRDTSGCLSLADRQSVPTPATSLRTGVSTLAQNIKPCRLRARASGHEMQNLFGSSRNIDAGQAAGRQNENDAKAKYWHIRLEYWERFQLFVGNADIQYSYFEELCQNIECCLY